MLNILLQPKIFLHAWKEIQLWAMLINYTNGDQGNI